MHEEAHMDEHDEPQHTFGGRRFDRYVYDFETTPGGDGGGDLGGLGGGELAEPPAAAAAPAAVVDDPAAVDDPNADPLTPEPIALEDLQAMIRDSSGEAFRELLAQADHEERQRQAAAQAAQAPELPPWDPFDPASVSAHVMAQLAPVFSQINQLLQPALETSESYNQAQGKEQATSILTAEQETLGGAFDHERAIKDAAYALRTTPGLDPEEALKTAAREQYEYEQRLEQRGAAKALGQVENGANAAQVAGGAAAPVAPALPRGPKGYVEQLRRSLETSRGGAPVA